MKSIIRHLLLTFSTIATIAFTLLVILAVLVLMGNYRLIDSDTVIIGFSGWRLGVIESSIIVLATGVAFDYVLHYSVAYRMSPNLPFPARIR